MEQPPKPAERKSNGCLLQVAAAFCTFILVLFAPVEDRPVHMPIFAKLLITAVQIAALMVLFVNFPATKPGVVERVANLILCFFVMLMALFNVGITWLR